MKTIRIIIVGLLLVVLCWLNWWVLPDLAIVRLEAKETRIPQAGLILLGKKNAEITGHRVVNDISVGWHGVPNAWPYQDAEKLPSMR